MYRSLAHVCLHVTDIGRTIAFYHGKLQLPLAFTFMKQGVLKGAYFKVSERTFIEAFEVAANGVVDRPNLGIAHFCLEVEDIDAFIAMARAAGITCTDKKLGSDSSWQSWLADPDGNRFEVHQYTERSAQQLGGVVEMNW